MTLAASMPGKSSTLGRQTADFLLYENPRDTHQKGASLQTQGDLTKHLVPENCIAESLLPLPMRGQI